MGILVNLAARFGINLRPTRRSVPRKSALKATPQVSTLEARIALTGGIAAANPIIEGPSPVFLGAIHSEFLERYKGVYTTVSADIGTVTAASSNAITLSRADGSQVTLGLTGSTIFTNPSTNRPFSPRILVGKQEELLSVNGAAVLGFVPNVNFLATQSHNEVTYYTGSAPAKETLDYGTVTAVTGNTLTILRSDGAYVTASINGSTKLGIGSGTYTPGQITRGAHILLEQTTLGTASRITIYHGAPGSFDRVHSNLFPTLN